VAERGKASRSGVTVSGIRGGVRNDTVRERGIGDGGDDRSLQAPRGDGSESVLG
jgi:hypothetical protein